MEHLNAILDNIKAAKKFVSYDMEKIKKIEIKLEKLINEISKEE